MKSKDMTMCTIVIIMLMIAIISLALNNDFLRQRIIKQQKEINKLENIILKGATRDSLIRDHFSKCSFISRDQVKIGYDNYLQYIPSEELTLNLK